MTDATRGLAPSAGACSAHQRIRNCTLRDAVGGVLPGARLGLTVSTYVPGAKSSVENRAVWP